MHEASSPVIVAIDFETAGYTSHSACAIGMAKIQNLEVTATFYHLLKPPSAIVRFSDIHGLYWDDLKDQPSFRDLWPEIKIFIKDAQFMAAHNATFDRKVWNGCCAKFSVSNPEIPFLCTCRGARNSLSLRSNALDSVCRHYGIEINHHHAGSDALACAGIFIKMVQSGCKLETMLLKPVKIP